MCISTFLYFHLFLIPITYSTTTTWPNSKCGNNTIRFPFRLKTYEQENPIDPGFDLRCNNKNMTVLQFPFSGVFYVRSIDYVTQQVQLYDFYDCLPTWYLHLNLNLSNSPFKAMYYQNFTFISCLSPYIKSGYTEIKCLRYSNLISYFATSSIAFAKSMFPNCSIYKTVPVPVSSPVKFDDPFPKDLSGDLRLTWNVPDCRDCEIKGGVCGLNSSDTSQKGCFDKIEVAETKSSGAPKASRIIGLCITIPAMICTLSVVLFICVFDRERFIRHATLQVEIISPQPTSTQPTRIISTGLDDSTIESYTKIVLGESGRVPGPNDGTCPICLADYSSKEIVRCIPECKHCFHALCIDEWLRMNSSCPVCRNSPSPAHV